MDNLFTSSLVLRPLLVLVVLVAHLSANQGVR